MNFMSILLQLLNENRLDELIAYIEENDFPPDEFDFEIAQELRRAKSSLLELLRDFREPAEKVGSSRVEDENFRSIRELLHEFLAEYMDLQFRVFVHAYDLYMRLGEMSEKDERAISQLKIKMLRYLSKKTIQEKNAPRDALIIAMARDSGMPSINKRAEYVHRYWDDNEELADLQQEPLSADRIRKILASARSGPA